MVIGRSPLLATLGIALALATGGCVKKQTVKTAQYSGSCEGACRHYVVCKSEEDGRVYRACVRECRFIFSEDGVEDEATLGELERLDCEEVIGFIEGDTGVPPGAQEPPTTEPAASRDRGHTD